jgi:hypothetical protein
MSFWQDSTGKVVTPKDSFESNSGTGFELFPDKTVLTVVISEIKWAEWGGQRYINVRNDVVDGQYKGRVQFDKLRVYGNDKQKDTALAKLAVLDGLAGGQLSKAQAEPTDMDLQVVTNKPLEIRVLLLEFKDKDTGEKTKNNWVSGYGKLGALSGSTRQVPQQQAAQQAYVPQQQAQQPVQQQANNFNDDIPF